MDLELKSSIELSSARATQVSSNLDVGRSYHLRSNELSSVEVSSGERHVVAGSGCALQLSSISAPLSAQSCRSTTHNSRAAHRPIPNCQTEFFCKSNLSLAREPNNKLTTKTLIWCWFKVAFVRCKLLLLQDIKHKLKVCIWQCWPNDEHGWR